MGKPDMVMRSYLSNRQRFADLFNGVFFQGRHVIKPWDLQEASERYSAPAEAATERFRDVKMFLKSGEMLRVLAVENQQHVDYTMPCRCMQYDAMEYSKQLKELKSHNKSHELLKTPAERLCGITRSDRLMPVYTLCLYHGEEPWDGPLSLRDMMDFGTDRDGFGTYFSDYPLRLFCVNSAESFDMFHTELRELFGALKYRRNRAGLRRLLETDKRYECLSADTAETISVLLNIPGLQEKWSELKTTEKEGDGYDMCQAILEMQEESFAEGKREGLTQGKREGIAQGKKSGRIQGAREKTKTIVRNMLKRGFSDEEICALAECTVEFIDSIR